MGSESWLVSSGAGNLMIEAVHGGGGLPLGAVGCVRARVGPSEKAPLCHRVVKEEISDDNARLPCFNGRVVSWVSPGGQGGGGVSVGHSLSAPSPLQLVLAEGAHSDTGSQGTDAHTDLPTPLERMAGIGDSRPPSFQ